MACRQRTGEAILHPYGDDRSRQGPAVERFPVHPQQDGLCRRACATWDFPLHRGRHERAAACRTMRHRSPRGWPCLRGLSRHGSSPARPCTPAARAAQSMLREGAAFWQQGKEEKSMKKGSLSGGQAPRVFAPMAAVARSGRRRQARHPELPAALRGWRCSQG